MASGDIWKVNMVFHSDDSGEDFASGFHFTEAAGFGAPTVAEVGDKVKDWWNVALEDGSAAKAFHPSTVSLDRITIRKKYPLAAEEFVYAGALNIAGTIATAGAAPNDAILVSLRTAFIGRSYRGRMFLPPPGLTQLSGPGTLAEGSAQAYADQMLGLHRSLVALASIDKVVVASFFSGYETVGGVRRPDPRPVPIATEVTQVKVDRYLRSQRRRTINTSLYVQAD